MSVPGEEHGKRCTCSLCRQYDEASAERRSVHTTDQARQAVVEAAVAWEEVARFPPGTRKNGHGICINLQKAVRAYLALTTPEGKRPEEVPENTRFRFYDPEKNFKRPADWITRRGPGGPDGPSMVAQYLPDNSIMFFDADTLIIPEDS